MEIRRKSGFFKNRRGKRLFYSLTMPETYSSVWIFCNPFLEEKVYTISIYKYFSDFLAKTGVAVFRFDYQGDGDSEGSLDDVNFGDWCDDIIDATQFAYDICNNSSINLFGLRLGGSLAWKVASKTKIDHILLWDPIIDGEDYLNQLLRYNLTTQLSTYGQIREERSDLMKRLNEGGTVNILGYEINQELSHSLCAVQLGYKTIPGSKISIVASSMSSNPKPSPLLHALVSDYSIELSMVKTRPFWHEPRFIDIRQQVMVDASMALINETDNVRHSICN